MESGTQLLSAVARLPDAQLIARVKGLAGNEREATTHLVAYLAELDARELYLGQGYPSLFKYCTQVLHLSEPAAFLRIRAARVARKFPVVLEKLQCGSLSLTTLKILAPVLTDENHDGVLASAEYQSKGKVEQVVAALHPLPDVPATIRKLPSLRTAGSSGAAPPSANLWTQPVEMAAAGPFRVESAEPMPGPGPGPAPGPAPIVVASHVFASAQPVSSQSKPSRALIAALSPDRYKIEFTASSDMLDKLHRAQDLLRHQIPDGDPAAVLDRALTALVAQLEKTRLGITKRPRAQRPHKPGSRNIPAAVRRAVWQRDGGRCAFVTVDGHRCGEPGFLQFHHVVPHGDGGLPSPQNIELRCRAHNLYEADLHFGPENKAVRSAVASKRAAKRGAAKEQQADIVPETSRSNVAPATSQSGEQASGESIARESSGMYGFTTKAGEPARGSRSGSGTSTHVAWRTGWA